METKKCNYCGYYGHMPFLHGSYHCPQCRYYLIPGETEDDQVLFDEELLETDEYPVYLVMDLLTQRS